MSARVGNQQAQIASNLKHEFEASQLQQVREPLTERGAGVQA